MAKAKQDTPPKHFTRTEKRYPALFKAWEAIGKAARASGPIDAKTAHLIQLAASAAVRSEGSVHSHVRRALGAGASPDEIRQAILLVSATAGFPQMMAALSWAEDVLGAKKG